MGEGCFNYLCCITLLLASVSAGRTQERPPVTVRSQENLEKACQGLTPGAVLQLSDGTYETTRPIRIEGKRGTAEAPIVLRAQHRGRAVIGGQAGFIIRDCEHLILEGFVLASDADQPAMLLDNCRQVRVTRNSFRMHERAKPRRMEHWLYVIGARSGDNRIDHNLFEHKVNSGSPVFVRGDDASLVCSQHDRIDHNYFRDIIFANGQNGHETIRTGSNDLGACGRSSFTTIEDNLLERCSGEGEIMSLKSSDNIVRRNTLVNCYGAICLRLGNRDAVYDNFILATDGEPGRGGVKLYGYEHRVFNNYFQGLTGARHEAPLALVPGTLDTSTTLNIGKKYDSLTTVPPTRAWVAFNTWIDCAPLQFGFEKVEGRRVHVPNECAFVNNLVVRTRPQAAPLLKLGLIRNIKAHDNLGYAGGPNPGEQGSGWFRYADPRLRRAEGEPALWRLTDASPAIDAAVEPAPAIDHDVFGQTRTGRPDIGAEEFGKSANAHAPLTPDDVGPDAPEQTG